MVLTQDFREFFQSLNEHNFIDLENLKKNKQATGRLQDLADLEQLE